MLANMARLRRHVLPCQLAYIPFERQLFDRHHRTGPEVVSRTGGRAE